jgi:hypothetical protein
MPCNSMTPTLALDTNLFPNAFGNHMSAESQYLSSCEAG